MKTLSEIAKALELQRVSIGMPRTSLSEKAGIAPKTLRHVLTGTEDFKTTTLLAVADRLGMELVLVPSEAARGLYELGESPKPVQSRVNKALTKLKVD
jgi:hypothetical protein